MAKATTQKKSASGSKGGSSSNPRSNTAKKSKSGNDTGQFSEGAEVPNRSGSSGSKGASKKAPPVNKPTTTWTGPKQKKG